MSLTSLPESVIQLISKLCLDDDLPNFGTISKHFSEFDEVWQGLFHHRFGYHGSRASRTRRGIQPRYSFFLALRGRRNSHSIIGHLIFKVISERDSPRDVKKLLPHDFPINKKFETLENSALLCLSAKFQRWKTLKMLIGEYNADINGTDEGGMSPLLYASWHGNVNIVKWLFSTPFHINSKAKGVVDRTSFCGGKGPYTALEWAKRKAEVCAKICPEKKSFNQIALYLSKKENDLR
mmetsp:Transcript_8573/g.8699  ORF Transcript_8573/g.8699 Transcript_8573/m.8699 type:complete len:237 (+) Transcript_8573:171-881(+)